ERVSSWLEKVISGISSIQAVAAINIVLPLPSLMNSGNLPIPVTLSTFQRVERMSLPLDDCAKVISTFQPVSGDLIRDIVPSIARTVVTCCVSLIILTKVPSAKPVTEYRPAIVIDTSLG